MLADLWPHVTLYDKQKQIIQSIQDQDETIVVAGNMLGKDFISGFIVLWYFLTRKPCRVVTTSVKDDHLRILWAEINRFIDTSKVQLDYRQGGPLLINHREIRRLGDKFSYMIGMVSERPEGLAGHHAEYTLAVIDEASGVADSAYTQMGTWAKRMLIIGNPNPCHNFFRKAEKDGRAIRIRATDSPNVQRGLEQQAQGIEPDNAQVIPGVLSWDLYCRRRQAWDKVRQCIGLDAQFWEGAESLLYPPEWLNESARRALQLAIKERREGPQNKDWIAKGGVPFIRRAKGGGLDPGEGGDADRMGTAWCIVDEFGILEMVEMRTTDTSVIVPTTKALLRKWNLDPARFCIDRGGGGKQIADLLRAEGHAVKTVGFGESATPDPKIGRTRVAERLDQREDRYAYPSKRAQMYHELRLALDPMVNAHPFAIPAALARLRQELAPIPLRYDREGRVSLPPKHRTAGKRHSEQDKTLTEIIGHSPDLADSLVLAYHAMRLGDMPRPRAGALMDREEALAQAR